MATHTLSMKDSSNEPISTSAIDEVINRCKDDLRTSIISIQYCNVLNASPTHLGGIYVFPMLEQMDEWQGIIFIHRGLYKGSILKFVVKFTPEYPRLPPKLFFKSNVYHPLVDGNGEFSFDQMYQNKSEDKNFDMTNLLMYLKSSFTTAVIEKLNGKLTLI